MRFLLILFLVMCAANIAAAQTDTPTPTPEPDIIFGDDRILDAQATAAAQLDQLPPDISQPNNIPLVPDTSQAVIVFGYAKWIAGGPAELFGPFAPIFAHFGLALTLIFTLAAIYAIVYTISYIIRWVIFLWRLVVQILQLIRG
jgi:hypothetical protein